MIKSTMKTALPVAIALALSACSSSDSSTQNTDGLVSSGVITGFGSIFVNGVEFETGSATFDIDGDSGDEKSLAKGMKVNIQGTINADGVTGTATHVSFDEELQGFVSGITPIGGQTRSFNVFDTIVIIDADSTKFDDDNGVFSFETIDNGNNVEISGFYDETGVLHATRVELENSNIVEVEGVISGLDGLLFTIRFPNSTNTIDVDASAAELKDLPNGSLVDGIKVEVEGTYDGSIIKADKVEGEDDELEDSENEIEIEGIITRYFDDSDFEVDGHPVDATGAEREPSSLTLEEGIHIEVEGIVSNNILIASEVKTRENENEVAALVSGVNIDAGIFTLAPVSGQPVITVRITSTTELEDEFSEIDSFSITDIQENDFIKVEGHINAADELEAKSVHRKDAADEAVVVEGIITAFDTAAETVTVLGVNFPYDGFTKFEINEVEVSLTDFFVVPGVLDGTATIAVEDNSNPADGFADKIELKD